MQGYINSIILIKKTDRDIQGFEYAYIDQVCYYSALEVLLLSLSYYAIKNFYGKVETDPQWFSLNYEYIKVGGESIDMLPKKSYISTLDGNIPLYFSIKQKGENNQAFCIEEFVLAMEQSEQHKDLSKEEQQTLNMLFTYIESNDDSKENDAIFKDIENNLHDIDIKLSQIEQKQKQQIQINNQKILEDILKNFITAYFPFSSIFFNFSGIDIIHKLTKTLLRFSFSKKLSTSLIEEFGLLYIITILNSKNKTLYIAVPKDNENRANAKLKQIKKKAFIQLARIYKTQAFEVIALGDITNNARLKPLKDTLRKKFNKEELYKDIKNAQKQEAAINRAINKELLKQKGLFAKEFITDTFKDFIKGLPQAQ